MRSVADRLAIEGGTTHGATGKHGPLRLLLTITSSDFGGAENILRELALRLDRDAFAPIVCSLRPPGQMAREIAAGGIPVVSLHLSAQPRATEFLGATLRLARLINRHDIDLVHSLLYRANVLCRLAARLSRRRPVVVSGHHTPAALGGRAATLASRWTRTFSDRMVVPSRAIRDELMRAERAAPERIVVIENGVDTHQFNGGPAAPIRSDLHLPANAFIVGVVGRFSPEKALHHLIESVALVREQGVPVHLLLIGDGPERARLEHDVHSRGIAAHVSFLGVRRDLQPLYAAMDVFALPSLYEAAPVALLEAMACGRAVIATDSGGAREMVEHERSGLLVAPAQPAALAAALLRLVTDTDLRQRLAATAARRVREHFDLVRMVERHAELYSGLVAGRGV